MPEPIHSGKYPSDYDGSGKLADSPQEQTQGKPAEQSVGLTTQESVKLFQEAVDTARRGYQSANSEAAGEILKPKLTVDLRGRGLGRLPKDVIAIIKQDVERLVLSHNGLSHIVYEFAQCAALKYLNLRVNNFQNIPKAIFGLPQLEILDLSNNQLSEIPDEIGSLRVLRVLCLQNNNIRDLPSTLLTIKPLRMLKLAGNPLTPDIHRITQSLSASLSEIKDGNTRDTLLTKRIFEIMREHVALKDSGEDSTDDGPLETPRAHGRFSFHTPYSHSTSGSESASDLRSPASIKPPLPTHSHTRIPSIQQNTLQMAAPRRPGLAPLTLGSERNRSNSESVLQSTSIRTKRNGLIGKKHSELRVLDETRAHRNSHHFRGQSHGSALRNGVRVGDSSPSGSPSGGGYQRNMVVRRLTSLPEQKRTTISVDRLVDSAKGVLYSLNMMHPTASALASAIKDGKNKRSSIERDFHSAIMHIEHLDQELLRVDSIPDGNEVTNRKCRRSVAQATYDCIIGHQRVTALLARLARHLVKDCDQRHLRTFMLMLFGSLNELINAGKSLDVGAPKAKVLEKSTQAVSTFSEVKGEGERTYVSDRSMTPTQRRKPDKRLKVGVNTQQTINSANLTPYGAQTAVPLYANGRSRSNSRAGAFHSSASSSVVNTPRSGESFSSAGLVARSRSGSVNVTAEQLRTEKRETVQFENIFSSLSRFLEEWHAVVFQLQYDFTNRSDTAVKEYASPKVRNQWASLVNNAMRCLEFTEALKKNLSNVRLNDREARNFRDFWQLGKKSLSTYSDLLYAIKDATANNILDPELKRQLKPMLDSARHITRLINTSPWGHLTFDDDPQATPQATPQVQTQAAAQNGYHHRTRDSSGSSAGGSSPYPANVPATPLSAALGPAAQATVPAPPSTPAGTIPATPGTASLERSFEGDIFQRADTYQRLQQTMIPRRPGL